MPYIELHKTYPEYHWFPAQLANATHSAENLAHQLHSHLHVNKKPVHATPPRSISDLRTYIRKDLLEKGLGVHDCTDEEVDKLVDSHNAWPASYIFADIISRRAQVGWSTHGHSAVDVPIFASNLDGASPLAGNHENTEVGKFLRDYLDVDVEAITKELKNKGVVMGKSLNDTRTRNTGDHYEGDFKLRRREACGCELH